MNKIKQRLDDYADAVYRRAQGNALISEVLDARSAVQAAIKEKLDAKDAEIAALRLDAERYPTSVLAQIVDKVTGEVPYDESFGTGGYKTYEYRAGADLDASVDTAMAQAVQPEGTAS